MLTNVTLLYCIQIKRLILNQVMSGKVMYSTPFMERKRKPLLDQVNIYDEEEYWRIRRLKETVDILGYSPL